MTKTFLADSAHVDAAWDISMLKAIGDASPMGILAVDVEKDLVLYCNRRFFEVCGLLDLEQAVSAGEIGHQDLLDACPMAANIESVDRADAVPGKLLADSEGMLASAEGRVIRRHASSIKLGDGQFPVRLYLFEDFTEQYRVAQRMRAAINGARDAIISVDLETELIIDANLEAQRLLRYTADQLVGQHWLMVHAPEEHDEARQRFDRYKEGTPHAIEVSLMASDGELIPVQANASVIEPLNGTRMLQAIMRDMRPMKAEAAANGERARLYEQMFRTNPAIKVLVDAESGRISDANAAAELFYGYARDKLLQQQASSLIGISMGDLCRGARAVESGGVKQLRGRHRVADGSVRDVEMHVGPVTMGDKTFFHVIVQDVTELSRQLLLHRNSKHILSLVVANRPLSVVLTEVARTIEARLPGASASILINRDGHLFTAAAPSLATEYCRQIDGVAIGSDQGSCGTAAYSKKAVIVADIGVDPRWTRWRELALKHDLRACWSLPLVNSQGKILGTFALYYHEPRAPRAQELSLVKEFSHLAAVAMEHSQLAAQLAHQAHHDALTGLPNRLLLRDRLEQAILTAHRGGGAAAVMLLDLDDFKLVNDSLGHSAGDQLLKAATHRLQGCVRATDTVARLGGDEFVIVLPLDQVESNGASVVAEKVLAQFSAPFLVNGHELYVSPSMGISLYPQDGDSAEVLLQSADTAMYSAKRAGKALYRYFAETMNTQLIERLTLEGELRKALSNSQLELFFQPRLLLSDSRIIGAEALVRWRHPERGLVPPGKFLPVAEQSNLINEIDDWVFAESLRHAARWEREGLDLILSINLTASRLLSPEFASELAAALDQAGISPHRIEIEITESMLMRDIDFATEQLRKLKRLAPGLRIAIDDFGSGYSSLNYLRHLPIDTLKIDRVFVADMADCSAAKTTQAIIRTIIELGRNLGLTVLAEGIEEEFQADLLREMGCDECQGFMFGRPMPLSEFESSLLARNPSGI